MSLALLLTACLLAAAAACSLWYWMAVRHCRRRAIEVLRWIELALAGQGQATGIRWIARSCFKVPLRLTSGCFHRASAVVEFVPCHTPWGWLANHLSGFHEVLKFQADLDLPPAFSLHVHNFRWFARSSRKSPVDGRTWTFQQTGPYVISTRLDWQKEISSTMTSLATTSTRDFLSLSFQRQSPQFAVTIPLESIAPGSPSRDCLFEAMRELASSSSTRFS